MSGDRSDPGGRIDLSTDVAQFFREAVDGAVQANGYDPTPAAEVYVAALLADFARNAPGAEAALGRPVTLMLDEALHTVGVERFERLRVLGDAVLYVTGFFGEHLSNRGVPLTYVSSLGSSAYDHAAVMLRQGGDGAACDVLTELSRRFEMFVEMLRSIADRLLARSARSDRDLLRVYERWLRTGSASLASALAGHGMAPMRGDGTVN